MTMLTTEEIARMSGVSRATVSAVINGKSGVREATRRKVLDIIEQHKEHAQFIRKSLVSEISRMIGVIIGSINNPFFTEVTSGIASVLRKNGFHDILLHTTDDRPGKLISDINVFMGCNPPGYIVVAGRGEEDEEVLRHLYELGRPMVAIGTLEGVNTHTVDVSNRDASRDATEYMISRGHRHMVYLTGPPYRSSAQERTLGFVEALVRHEIEYANAMTVRAGETMQGGYDAAMSVLANPETRPTAIVCFNDQVAAGVYLAARELELRIPQDLSVMGYDGIEMGALMGPPLTTLSVSPKSLGTAAAELLLDILAGDNGQAIIQRTIPHKVIIRDSVIDAPAIKHEPAYSQSSASN